MEYSINQYKNKFVSAEIRDFMGFPFIDEAKSDFQSRFDAIYIPTNFKRGGIAQDINILEECSEKIIILESKASDRFRMNPRFQCDAEIINFIEVPVGVLLRKKSSLNPSRLVDDSFDLPEKRNFALIHARENNYKKILLLDDDIVINKNDLCFAAGLIEKGYPLVGYYVLDFPDISCIDHVFRLKGAQSTRVSVAGNCLGLDVEKVGGFFPYCYNEDWLFIYGANSDLKTASAGYAMQLSGEPWNNEQRVRFEQFGDVISFGMKENAIKGRHFLDGDLCFWQRVYKDYRSLLKGSLSFEKNVDTLDEVILVALDALDMFTPREVIDFIETYRKEIQDEFK